MHKLFCGKNEKGITIKYNKDKFSLAYPRKIWESYPDEIKGVLVDNLTHLLTISMPVVAGINHIKYNTSAPLFRNEFKKIILKSIPSAVEGYKMKTDNVINMFKKIKYEFKDNKIKKPSFTQETSDTAVHLLSFGKDSLTSLGVCNEIGLKTKPIYINETVSPRENKAKIKRMKIFRKKFNFESIIIKNEIEKLNDFEYWNRGESCLSYMHMVTGSCFISLPVSNYFRARYVVVGNEKEMDFTFTNQDGFVTYPSPDQTSGWVNKQNSMIKLMTKNVGVISLIEPLTNIALMKILHKRYKDFGKYQLSCGCLDATDEKRWCNNCSQCANLYLLIKANGTDAKNVGFNRDLFKKKYKKFYILFGGNDIDGHEKTEHSRDEQLLAFYMAYKNREGGYLIELFKKKFLDEAKEREDKLRNFFFGIHKNHIPPELKKQVESIYREELGKF